MQDKMNEKTLSVLPRAMIFVLVAIAGFAYVKWAPYYSKAFVAYSHHSIGDSIISAQASSAPPASWSAAVDYALVYGKAIWKALVLGLILGSGIKALLPSRWISAALGRLGFRSVFLGALFGIPCMMCTCCAAPVVVGMKRSHASVGSAVSWWLANPVLNPATLVFMGFVLGWGWALFRFLFGIAMVLGIACLAERFAGQREINSFVPDPALEADASTGNFLLHWVREFAGMSIRLLPEYFIIVLLLGAARGWLFPAMGASGGIGWIAAMAFAGTLFVIPTAGEVPIAQAAFALGMGVGPAAALIMTLPAISLPSLAMLGSVLNLRTRFVITAGVVLSGMVAGLAAPLLF